MNRSEIIKHLNSWIREHNVDPYSSYLAYGGALLMHGIIDKTEDINLKVDKRIWAKFDNGKFEKSTLSAKGQLPEVESIKVTEHIKIQLADKISFAELDFDRGIAFRTIPATLKDYQLLNRPKDQARIQLINDFIAIGSQ